MPVDLEQYMGTSPPMFGQCSFFGGGYLPDYQTLLQNQANSLFHSQANIFSQVMGVTTATITTTSSNLRPCLFRQDTGRNECYDSNDLFGPALCPTSKITKKRVVFADDRGFKLTHVRVMTEPSHCPPRWTPDYLEQITKGSLSEKSPSVTWVLDFKQPCTDYLNFKERLDTECVALENVRIKSEDDTVTGTVKVKNLSFEKEVVIRTTFDGWENYEDVHASYLVAGAKNDKVVSLYDTFTFNIKIPANKKINRMEMCVCFRCNGKEYWDSNEGNNYAIYALAPKNPTPSSKIRCDDALKINMNTWTEFASWNHLTTQGPYW